MDGEIVKDMCDNVIWAPPWEPMPERAE